MNVFFEKLNAYAWQWFVKTRWGAVLVTKCGPAYLEQVEGDLKTFVKSDVGIRLARCLVPVYQKVTFDEIVSHLKLCFTTVDPPPGYASPITYGSIPRKGNPSPPDNSKAIEEFIAQAALRGQVMTIGGPNYTISMEYGGLGRDLAPMLVVEPEPEPFTIGRTYCDSNDIEYVNLGEDDAWEDQVPVVVNI